MEECIRTEQKLGFDRVRQAIQDRCSTDFAASRASNEQFCTDRDEIARRLRLTDEMREVLHIEPGRDGYLRWLLGLGGYQNLLKIDTGLEDPEVFDRDIRRVAERTRLNIREADEGWADLQPTEDLYAKAKSFLAQ